MFPRLFRVSALTAAVILVQASDFSCSTGDSLGPGGIRVTGEVHFAKVEAGCWVLQADSGRRYELRPGQAPPEILVEGARVTVVLEPRTDLTSICMVGEIADVERVESVRLP